MEILNYQELHQELYESPLDCYCFLSRRFPVGLCFSMAIDKVIGQSINDGVEEVEMVEMVEMVAELKVV